MYHYPQRKCLIKFWQDIFLLKGFQGMAPVSLELNSLLDQLGQAGRTLSEIGAAEGAAGNLSICFRESLEFTALFPKVQNVELPVPVPDLAGATLIVTGSGRRLRDILDAPTDNLACIIVERGGRTGQMFTSYDCPFQRVTSEFNSHLAVHHDQMRSRDIKFHTVLHGQPVYLTFLSHLTRYQEERYLNRHLLRWQPEMIFNFPQGLGILPFLIPGSAQLTVETMLALREHKLVIWSQHGIMARSDDSIFHALDIIEYAETAAHYECLNLMGGDLSPGLTPNQIQALAESLDLRQNIF
jgi:rhamnulose-1-phosphate aldolase